MEFWYVIIGVITFIALFPYIRCLFKRLILKSKIKKICLKNGYQLYTNHAFWFLGSKYSKRCDLYIETTDDVLSVKLFGMPSRRAVLVLKEDNKFFIRRFFLMTYYVSIVLWPINSKDKTLPSYDFKYAYKNEWENKKLNKILLVNPVGMQFRYVSPRGAETTVRDGDRVNYMTVISLSQFLNDLKSAD